jgi:hypothetical protein
MPEPAPPPAPPPTPTPPAQPTPPPPRPEPPRPEPKPEPQSATLTLDQVKSLIADERKGWDAERVEEKKRWETEAIPKIRESIEAPIRRQAKIAAIRQELQAAGKYLPADDDSTDPSNPGDLAALADLDDSITVHTDKSGTKLTRLDVELNRVRTRLGKRTAKKTGDALGTPPFEAGPDEFDAIRKQTQAAELAARDARKSGLARVFPAGVR